MTQKNQWKKLSQRLKVIETVFTLTLGDGVTGHRQ